MFLKLINGKTENSSCPIFFLVGLILFSEISFAQVYDRVQSRLLSDREREIYHQIESDDRVFENTKKMILEHVRFKSRMGEVKGRDGNRVDISLKTTTFSNHDLLYDIVPVFDKKIGKLIITINLAEKAKNHPLVYFELQRHIDYIFPTSTNRRRFLSSSLEWAELTFNAQLGSEEAQRDLLRLNTNIESETENLLSRYLGSDQVTKEFHSDFKNSSEYQGLAKEYFGLKQKMARKKFAELNERTIDRKEKFNRTRLAEIQKVLEENKGKLEELVAKNDRVETARLVEKLLPWEIMLPTERFAWNEWLDAIRNPRGSKTYLLRGDANFSRNSEGEAYFLAKGQMSSILDSRSDQVNLDLHRRRIDFSQEVPMAATVSLVAEGQAMSSRESIFVSTTTDPRTAYEFARYHPQDYSRKNWKRIEEIGLGSGKTFLIAVDRRRVLPNPSKEFKESEVLVPVAIFPDEIVKVLDISVDKMEEALERELRRSSHRQTANSYLKDRFQNFFPETYTHFGALFARFRRGKAVNKCRAASVY